LIVWGSTLVLKLLDRFPIIVTLGAALLGWIGGSLIINDPAGDRWPMLDSPGAEYGARIVGALFVVLLGYWIKRRALERERASTSSGPSEPRG
jgi:predicted tellurium resistance membrane protein TerC